MGISVRVVAVAFSVSTAAGATGGLEPVEFPNGLSSPESLAALSEDGVFHDFDVNFLKEAMTGPSYLGGAQFAANPYFDGDFHGVSSVSVLFECSSDLPIVARPVDGSPTDPAFWDSDAARAVADYLRGGLDRFSIKCPLGVGEIGTFSVQVDL